MMKDPRQTFEQARRKSVGELLLRTARRLDETALERLRSHPGAPPVRPAHTRLFPHLDFQGVRATVLADKLGISKQAVGQLLADLVEWGIVEQVPDPTDGRARLTRYSPEGAQALAQGLSLLSEIEEEVSQRVGPEAMSTFHTVLEQMLEVLGDDRTGR